jgi:hypothetical protein
MPGGGMPRAPGGSGICGRGGGIGTGPEGCGEPVCGGNIAPYSPRPVMGYN